MSLQNVISTERKGGGEGGGISQLGHFIVKTLTSSLASALVCPYTFPPAPHFAPSGTEKMPTTSEHFQQV